MATHTIPLPETGQAIEHQNSYPAIRQESLVAAPTAFPHSFSRRLLFRLLKIPDKDKRVLRALEYLFFRVLTQQGTGRYGRRLRQEKVIDGLLMQYKVPDASRIGLQAVERYQDLIEEALSTRSAAELQEKKLLELARAVKHDLGHHFLGKEVIKASVACLLVFERLYQTPGFAAPGRVTESATTNCRLPMEPHPERSTPRPRYRSTVFSWEQIDGGPKEGSQKAQLSDEGHAVASLRPEELKGATPNVGGALPANIDGVAVWNTPREVPAPPWERPDTVLRQTAKIRMSRKGKSRRSSLRSQKEAATDRQNFGYSFLGVCLKGVIAMCLAIVVIGGAGMLSEQAPEVVVRPDLYQAYYFADPGLQALFPAARRVKGALLLTVSDQWKQLDLIGQHARVARLARNLLEQEGLSEILVLDSAGNTLARARGASVEVLAGGDTTASAPQK